MQNQIRSFFACKVSQLLLSMRNVSRVTLTPSPAWEQTSLTALPTQWCHQAAVYRFYLILFRLIHLLICSGVGSLLSPRNDSCWLPWVTSSQNTSVGFTLQTLHTDPDRDFQQFHMPIWMSDELHKYLAISTNWLKAMLTRTNDQTAEFVQSAIIVIICF